ncbi:MAG: alpha/beta hydrolase [Desulfomonile tiedjei]|nr:alpha/beta hydrolase [Desulfomonile tiedjei]
MRSSPNRLWSSLLSSMLVLVLIVAASLVCAEPITRLSGVPDLESLKKYYSVPNFAIGGKYDVQNEASFEFGGTGGVTLESLGREPLRLSYIAVGTPQRDKDGKIVNAVIVSSYYSGDSAFMYFFWYDGQKGNAFAEGPYVGPGKLIDTDKHYVIFLDALGLWGTSKPSDGLGMKFPKYSISDCVQANYRLLKDHLGVAKVKLATGVSMGGIQSYVLAVLHPDFVEAIMPIGGITASDPVSRWLFQLMTAAMQSDPVWQKTKGDYYSLPKDQHPNKGMMFGWSVLGETGFGFDFRVKQKWDEVKKEVFFWEPKDGEGANLVSKAKDFDVDDLLCRNQCLETYDINDQLGRIKAKTLILHVKNDQWLRYVLAEEAASRIQGAKLVGYESPLAHYAVFRGPNVCKDAVTSFFKEIGMK